MVSPFRSTKRSFLLIVGVVVLLCIFLMGKIEVPFNQMLRQYYGDLVPQDDILLDTSGVQRQTFNSGISQCGAGVFESICGTGITMEEIRNKTKMWIQESVRKDPRCAAVHRNLRAYWRSVPKHSQSMNEDFKRMNIASQCGAFHDNLLMSHNPNGELMAWEKDYLSMPVFDGKMADTTCAALSEVTYLNTSRRSVVIGDTAHFRITLRDCNKLRKTSGGDKVRLWLETASLNAHTAADVVDNKDGSYLATALLPWSGKVTVKVAVAFTRSLLRTQLYIQRIYKGTHWFTGNFVSQCGSEATPCSPFPALPGFARDEVCNMTHQNGGFQWYCGKPVKSACLKCEHYVSTRKLNVPASFPLSMAEQQVLTDTEKKRPFFIPNSLILHVGPRESENVLSSPKVPCYKRPFSESVQDTNMMSGFFYKRNWRALKCTLPNVDKQFLRRCLVNTTLILLGDSNTRQQHDTLTAMTECEQKILKRKVKWHAPLRCDIDQQNTSIRYYPPKNPFYGSVGESLKHSALYSESEVLDSIPSTGNYIVQVHHMLHLVPFHLSVLKNRLRLFRAAVVRLLARNRHVKVIYQPAHTAYETSYKNKFKVIGFAFELQRDILRGLGDRFLFVNTWSMTVSVGNKDAHPLIQTDIMKVYMGHVCPS